MAMTTYGHLGWGNFASPFVGYHVADCPSLSFQPEVENFHLRVGAFSVEGYLEDRSQPFHLHREAYAIVYYSTLYKIEKPEV